MHRYLTFEDGLIMLGDVMLPGILKNLSIRGSVRFDEAAPDSQSGKVKTPQGWDDADISIAVELLTDDESTCYQKLKNLNSIFKGYDSNSNPKVYKVNNSHLRARGVDLVVFSGLESTESDQDDVVQCSLYFKEHLPAIIKVEERTAGANKNIPPADSKTAKTDNTIVVDLS